MHNISSDEQPKTQRYLVLTIAYLPVMAAPAQAAAQLSNLRKRLEKLQLIIKNCY